MNRYLEHDEHIGAGSVEICRATFLLDARKKGEDEEKLISVEGKLDTCGSVSLSHSSHLQQVKDCRKYGLKGVVLSGIGGKSKPLREAGVLHVKTNNLPLSKEMFLQTQGQAQDCWEDEMYAEDDHDAEADNSSEEDN